MTGLWFSIVREVHWPQSHRGSKKYFEKLKLFGDRIDRRVGAEMRHLAVVQVGCFQDHNETDREVILMRRIGKQ